MNSNSEFYFESNKNHNNYELQNIYLIDRMFGDVNGDNIPDTVSMIGKKKENPFYEDIEIIVLDGAIMNQYVIPLYHNYSMSYSPWLFLGSFSGFNAEDIMVSLPVGGSGALTYYYVISFLNNNANIILDPELFMAFANSLEFEIIYMDHYKVLVKSKKLNQSYIIDISDKKDVYEKNVYNENGELIKPLNGFVIDQPHLYPIKFDGNLPYKLEARQEIAGTSHADRLGYIITYWKYSVQGNSWVLDPELFFLMI
ncbi:hypothetical protein [Anaerosacchariphilus polymeriproducens]|uniref:Spore coat protein n=1 Tax=Anaerosacchariphilus polymeriproducens TaxID=1812858 RepID=A0A371AZG2_9FIRM|nr:hypothetical protein [Anaerosacchariphilus polymeriproducens]RDU24984.1 hypothetical protein DWV06_01790 [Anaerosacchariphilus polymeriproducens]